MFSMKNLKQNNLIIIAVVLCSSLIIAFLVMEIDKKDQIIKTYESKVENEGDIIYEYEDPLDDWDFTKFIYPENLSAGITITGHSDADEWGDWKKVIPENKINKDYKIVSIWVANFSDSAANYMIHVCYGDNREGCLGYDIFMNRHNIGSDIPCRFDKEISANDPLWIRLKSDDGAEDSVSFWIKYIKKK